jgi:hypothetical protein
MTSDAAEMSAGLQELFQSRTHWISLSRIGTSARQQPPPLPANVEKCRDIQKCGPVAIPEPEFAVDPDVLNVSIVEAAPAKEFVLNPPWHDVAEE